MAAEAGECLNSPLAEVVEEYLVQQRPPSSMLEVAAEEEEVEQEQQGYLRMPPGTRELQVCRELMVRRLMIAYAPWHSN